MGICKFTGRERHGKELFFCMLIAIPSAVADGKSIHPSHVIHILSAVFKRQTFVLDFSLLLSHS